MHQILIGTVGRPNRLIIWRRNESASRGSSPQRAPHTLHSNEVSLAITAVRLLHLQRPGKVTDKPAGDRVIMAASVIAQPRRLAAAEHLRRFPRRAGLALWGYAADNSAVVVTRGPIRPLAQASRSAFV